MTKKIDRSSQTENTFEEENMKSYYLRPRRKLIKCKKPSKRNQIYRNSKFLKQIQFGKTKNSSSLQLFKSYGIHPESLNTNSNRSSTTQVESSRSKSSNYLTSDEEGNTSVKKEKMNIPLSSSLTSIKRSRKILKLMRPQTCPPSLCLRIIPPKSENLTLNKKQLKIGKLDEENHPQRTGSSLSDVVLRKKESYLETAHQSTSDKGLKLRFPRKRSIRTSLKDVLSSSKSKRRLIENSNQNLRDEEKQNFLDLCSGSVEPMSNDFASDAYVTVMVQQEKKTRKMLKENMIEDKKLTDAAFQLEKSKSHLIIDQGEQKSRRFLDSSSKQEFQDRGEFIFDKNLQLMTNYFKDAIHALHESIIIKKEKESRDLKLNAKTISSGGDKQASRLFSKMEEIARTNEDAEKNKQDPKPGVERKVDRFWNLLEKISMLRGDVTILLADAAKNDKTLEFHRNLRNLSRSSNREPEERFLTRENKNDLIEKPQSSTQNHPSHKNTQQSDNTSIIDKNDDIQILKVITNRNRSNFYHSETNHLDGDYHFLMSLYQPLKKMPQGRKLKMRLKMQQLFYEELCTVDSD